MIFPFIELFRADIQLHTLAFSVIPDMRPLTVAPE